MTANSDLAKLTVYIEENLRTSERPGIPFVDPRRLARRVVVRQNHILFGRRGAGKTRLLRAMAGRRDQYVTVYVNLEDYKDRRLAEAITHVLATAFAGLGRELKEGSSWFHFKRNALRKKLKRLEASLLRRRADEAAAGELFRAIPEYKELIRRVSEALDERAIYLALDDFYFISTLYQPDLLDYFHRLAKDTALFLKVATILERSVLYRAGESEHVGMELGHDAHPIDLDFTLDKFEELKDFMRELLRSASEDSGAHIHPDAFFRGNGFAQLCLASEGVPRNFLSLFAQIANRQEFYRHGFIGTEEVLAVTDPEKTGFVEAPGPEVPGKENFFARIFQYLKAILTRITEPRKKPMTPEPEAPSAAEEESPAPAAPPEPQTKEAAAEALAQKNV